MLAHVAEMPTPSPSNAKMLGLLYTRYDRGLEDKEEFLFLKEPDLWLNSL